MDEGDGGGRGAFWGRLLVGHVAAYPAMLAVSVATMSLSIIARSEAIEAVQGRAAPRGEVERWLVAQAALSPPEAASFALIMEPILWVLGLLFVVAHLASVPWALAARRAAAGRGDRQRVKRGARLFIASLCGLTGLGVIAGAVGWVVILTR